MIRLALGKLYDQAALLPRLLDERIRRIAAVVGGGLTPDSLDPTYRIPAGYFAQPYTRAVLAAALPNVAGANPTVALAAPTPNGAATAYVVGFRGVVRAPPGAAARVVTVKRGKYGSTATTVWSSSGTVAPPRDSTAFSNQLGLCGNFSRLDSTPLAAGEQLWLDVGDTTAGAWSGYVEFELRMSAST